MRKAPQLRFPGFESGWQQYRMGDLTRIFDGTHQTPKYVSSGIPFYSVENVTANNFTDTKYITEEAFTKETKRIERGDILMTRIGDIGTARCIDWDVKASFYVSLALIKSSEGLNSKFLCHYIASDYFQDELWAQTLHVAFPKKINLGDIGSCKISISDIREQQKIADFLTAVDERIELQSNKVEKLETYKRGLTQKIFTRTLRFKRDDGSSFDDWQPVNLGELLHEVNDRAEVNDAHPVVSSTTKGLFLQSDYFNKSIASEDNVGYKVLRMNQVVFSPQNLWMGNINFNDKFEVGIVSPSYKIFCVKSIDPKFVKFIIKLPRMTYEYKQASAEGASIVRRNLDMESFKSIKLQIPSTEERQKIATFLSQIDEKITLETKKLKSLKKFKKSLLQKMFI